MVRLRQICGTCYNDKFNIVENEKYKCTACGEIWEENELYTQRVVVEE